MLSGARPSVRQPRVGSWSCRMTLHAPQQLAEIKNSSILEAQWSTSVLNGNIQPLVDPARGHWHCHTIGVLQREASIWFLLSGHRIKTTQEAMHFQGFGLWDPFDCLRHCLLKDILLTSQIFCHAERALKQLRCKTVWLLDHFIPFSLSHPFPLRVLTPGRESQMTDLMMLAVHSHCCDTSRRSCLSSNYSADKREC